MSGSILTAALMSKNFRIKAKFFIVLVFLIPTLNALAQSRRLTTDKGEQITDLSVIQLHYGINRIARFAPDGRAATIVEARRFNGNAHGYNLFLVMMDNAEVVGVDRPAHFEDVIRDNPHTGEDAIKSIRFAHGKVGAATETFLITATRELSHSISLTLPSHVTIDLYQLAHFEKIGTTKDFFEPISEFRSKKMYCNSDLALFKEIGLPLPVPYYGPNKINGCP